MVLPIDLAELLDCLRVPEGIVIGIRVLSVRLFVYTVQIFVERID